MHNKPRPVTHCMGLPPDEYSSKIQAQFYENDIWGLAPLNFPSPPFPYPFPSLPLPLNFPPIPLPLPSLPLSPSLPFPFFLIPSFPSLSPFLPFPPLRSRPP